MTLPTSGSISIAQIATELGIALPLNLADSRCVTLAGKALPLTIPTDFYGKSNFTPSTNTYDTSGAGTETIPSGASQVVIECWGAGAGGGGDNSGHTHNGGGGGSGGYVKKTHALTSADWGKTFTYAVGGYGVYGNSGVNGTNGSPTTAANGTYSTATSLSAGGGNGGVHAGVGGDGLQGTGGTASGGDVNTAGNPTSAAVSQVGDGAPNGGGSTSSVGTTPGGGGEGAFASGAAYSGANGRVKFSYT